MTGAIKSDAADYHNSAAKCAREGDKTAAFNIVLEGLERYPVNIDLLADAIAYGDGHDRLQYLQQLDKMGYECWNWRAFLFSIDYLLESLNYASDSSSWGETEWKAFQQDAKKTRKNAFDIALEYQKAFPNDERAYKAYADILLSEGSKGKHAAKEYYRKIFFGEGQARSRPAFPVAQCCVAFADMLAEDGEYEEVIRVCRLGIAGTAQEQPSSNVGYMYYLMALSEDALLHLQRFDGECDLGFPQETVREPIIHYRVAYRILSDSFNEYRENAKRRVTALSFEAGLELPSEFSDNARVAHDLFEALRSNEMIQED